MSLSNYLIPVINQPQSFGITLAGVQYVLTFKWNNADDSGWIFDISDLSNNPIACNIPLITGADCVSGLEYLGFDGEFLVLTNQNETAVPTFTNLGIDCNLYFQTDNPNE